MSQTNQETTRTGTTTFRIPSLLTNSLRSVFNAFGEDIINLRARGGVHINNQTDVDHLSEYGVTFSIAEERVIDVDYELIDPEDPYNPMDEDAKDNILQEAAARLENLATDHPPDLAVNRLVITVESQELMDASEARTPDFDLKFVSERAKDPYRGRTQDQNRDRGLYEDLGFEVRNLNLHAVYEREKRYSSDPGDGKIMSWQGIDNDTRPRAPDPLMRAVYNEILPDEDLSVLKNYEVRDEEVVEPVQEGESEEESGDNDQEGSEDE